MGWISRSDRCQDHMCILYTSISYNNSRLEREKKTAASIHELREKQRQEPTIVHDSTGTRDGNKRKGAQRGKKDAARSTSNKPHGFKRVGPTRIENQGKPSFSLGCIRTPQLNCASRQGDLGLVDDATTDEQDDRPNRNSPGRRDSPLATFPSPEAR